MSEKINIGLFGFGCVGQGLYDILQQKNFPFHVERICVKDKLKQRAIDASNFSYDKNEILKNEKIKMVVELIDDADEAYQIVKQALISGKSVVTANKKMLAEHQQELLQLQRKFNTSLYYEASCCGSIPIIRLLNEYFSNDELNAISGIFNGTSNFILTKMTEEHLGYDEALKIAQEKGFAESDPHLDVSGKDAANKLSILAAHAFGVFVKPGNIFIEGIENISAADILFAQKNYSRIKLIASAEIIQNALFLRVAPQFIQRGEQFYEVDNEFNAVLLEAKFAGSHFFKGKGAGSLPTGLAVVTDLTSITRNPAYQIPDQTQFEKVTSTDKLLFEVYIRTASSKIFSRIQLKNTSLDFTDGDDHVKIGFLAADKIIEAKELLGKHNGILIFTGKKKLMQPHAQIEELSSLGEIVQLN